MKENKKNKNVKNEIKKNKKNEVKIKEKETKNSKRLKFWDDANEIKKLIAIFLIVVAVFVVFYILTLLIDKNRSNQPEEDSAVAVIQYDEILVGEILNQNRDAYYVLATEGDNEILPYQSYIDTYMATENPLKIYEVDLNSVFNKKFLAEESNFEIDKISDIRFSDATLLKVENGNLTEYYQGDDEITDYLKELNA